MEQKYLIDTCAVIKYLDEIFPLEALSFMDDIVDNILKPNLTKDFEKQTNESRRPTARHRQQGTS